MTTKKGKTDLEILLLLVASCKKRNIVANFILCSLPIHKAYISIKDQCVAMCQVPVPLHFKHTIHFVSDIFIIQRTKAACELEFTLSV